MKNAVIRDPHRAEAHKESSGRSPCVGETLRVQVVGLAEPGRAHPREGRAGRSRVKFGEHVGKFSENLAKVNES